jgi:hypothetical protein
VHRRGPLGLFLVVALGAIALGPGAGRADAAPTPNALLPDLAVMPPSQFSINVTASGKRRLHFTTRVVNIGVGPFQLKGSDLADNNAQVGDILSVRQQVREPDGSLSGRDTAATMVWSGDGHNHWHVRGLQDIRLQSMEAEVLGRVNKIGFCFLDSFAYGSNQPSRYNSAHQVCQTRANGTVQMGVSVKWGDTYPSTIAFQWIDITGLPNGKYRLKVLVDPPTSTGGQFLESNEENNAGWTKIRITGNSVTILRKSPNP